MKVAVVGSRTITVDNIGDYLPSEIDEIVSGGASGVDRCARKYAENNGIKLTEFLPDYRRFGKGAPLRRNLEIIRYADYVIAFWDGSSSGTKHVIDNAKKLNKKLLVCDM